jgi:sugar lactone lactonase YvrE
MNELKPLLTGLAFGECLRWYRGRLYFSDMHAHQVVAMEPDGGHSVVCEVPGRPGGIGWLPDGRMLVVAITERKLLRLDPDGLKVHADLAPLVPNFLNDMVVDDCGRAWIGNIGFDYYGGERMRSTFLVMVSPSGDARIVADDLHSPNGMSILKDGRTLMVAESAATRLTAFTVHDDGSLHERRVWADLKGGVPDGIAADAEDHVWCAMYGGKSVWRVAEGGEIKQRVDSATDTFACALGGDKRRTLYVATATTHDPDECRKLRSGHIEAIQVAVSGAGPP